MDGREFYSLLSGDIYHHIVYHHIVYHHIVIIIHSKAIVNLYTYIT